MLPDTTIHFINGRQICNQQYAVWLKQSAYDRGFKAGEQESDKKWRQILKDSVALAKQEGIREVTEWMNLEFDSSDCITEQPTQEAYKAKLKEWGIKGVNNGS